MAESKNIRTTKIAKNNVTKVVRGDRTREASKKKICAKNIHYTFYYT
jgi:hypothetical protein